MSSTMPAEKKIEGPVSIAVGGPQPSDNHVYFYDDVTESTILRLIQQLKETDLRLRVERIQRDLPDSFSIPIKLHISSFGGSLLAALNAYDHIKQSRTPIHTYIEGYACSAGTILSVAGEKRFIMPNAYSMIHQFTTLSWGTYEQFKDDMKLNDDLIERLRQIYVKNSKMKLKEVTKLLKHDTWFNSKETLEKGLVDEIVI